MTRLANETVDVWGIELAESILKVINDNIPGHGLFSDRTCTPKVRLALRPFRERKERTTNGGLTVGGQSDGGSSHRRSNGGGGFNNSGTNSSSVRRDFVAHH
jgi:hypothetical protein